jgi:CRP-like cAMP-binding protein
VVGLRALLGAEASPRRLMVQFPGGALRVRADVVKDWSSRGGPLAHWLSRYVNAFLTHAGQLAACNAVHTLHQRCCRWLLMTHDRVQSDELPVTQKFLAQMLGVRRAGVTEVAGPLQDEGLIRYSRGRVVILDRHKLEGCACECYRIIREDY